MSCDVAQWLKPGDSPDQQIEGTVHSAKRAVAIPVPSRTSGRRLRPPRTVAMDISCDTGERLTLKAYQDGRGPDVQLLRGSTVLRHFHIHDGHHNPGGRPVDAGHKHFPTKQYPLRKAPSSYAYPVECPTRPMDLDLNDAIELFCEEVDIEIVAAQTTLAWEGMEKSP